MKSIKITVTGCLAAVTEAFCVVSGTVGLPVEFTFDDAWEGLNKTAVFRVNGKSLDRLNIAQETTVPWELLMAPGCRLWAGVYGTNADGTLQIPTVWADLGIIQPGADPSGDESADPSLPVWEQAGKDAVKYMPQALTEEQQAQARQNIGAMAAGIQKEIWINSTENTASDVVLETELRESGTAALQFYSGGAAVGAEYPTILGGLADGENDTDATTVGQVKEMVKQSGDKNLAEAKEYTDTEISENVGDISTALDELHDYAQAFGDTRETVVDGYSPNNDRISQAFWAPFILDEAVHGHNKYKNKNIVAIKAYIEQVGTLSIGRIKTIDYTSGTFNEELIVERISLNIENAGEQTIELPTPIKVNSDEDLFIGYNTDTAKIKYGNTEKDQGFFYKVNGGITFVNQSVSLGVSVFASTEIEAKESSIYQGKKLSILGDSISTFDGYIPQGNATWYPKQSIVNVEQTWWKMTLEALGMVLDTNNSCSGSCVSYERNSRPTGLLRCENLGEPDVIVVWMGINDFVYAGRSLGSYNGKTEIPAESDSMDFRSAYAVMLNKILTAHPTAEIWVCTLPTTDFSAIGTDSVFPKLNKNGNTILEYNTAIKELADAFSVNVIELDKCGITWQNLTAFTDDKLHPNINGHLKISSKVVRTLDPSVQHLVNGGANE